MKRVLFAAHNGNMGGGAERSLLEILQYIHKERNDISILVIAPFEGSFTHELKKSDIPFTTQRLPYAAFPSIYPEGETKQAVQESMAIGFAEAQLKAVKSILNFKPDLVISNTIVTPWFIYAAKVLQVPTLLFVRELFDERNGIRTLLPSPDQYIARLLGESDHLFFNSKYTESLYSQYSTSEKSSVLYPSVSIPEDITAKAIKSVVFKQDTARAIILGNIKAHKNQLQVVNALAHIQQKYPDKKLHLTIMGSAENAPSYVEELKRFITEHNLDSNVTFRPFSNTPYETIIEHDILIMASSHEAFGRVTLEGQLLGRLVIGADSAGTREIISHKETGLLYKEGSAEDLAEKIVYSIDNPKKSQEIATRALNDSAKKFSQNNTLKPLIDRIAATSKATYPHAQDLLACDDVRFMLRNEHLEEELQKYGKALSEASERIAQLETQLNHSSPSVITKLKRVVKNTIKRKG